MRHTARYGLIDRKRDDILEKLKVDAVQNKLAHYKQKRLNRSRMEDFLDTQKRLLDFRPIERRKIWTIIKETTGRIQS
jgi:hypothetical protein